MFRVATRPLTTLLLCVLLERGAAAEDPPKIVTDALAHAVVAGRTYKGVELQIDLPGTQHVRNIGAPKDGKGLCVFASMDMAARWHTVRPLVGIMNQIPYGGGWPEKVDAVLKEHAPDLSYVQYEGTSPLLMDKALREHHPVCVTYGYGERYGMRTIYHMVLLVYLDAKYAAILDNNFPGEDRYEWMPRDEFLKRWTHPSGKGWCFVFLASPPPPAPCN